MELLLLLIIIPLIPFYIVSVLFSAWIIVMGVPLMLLVASIVFLRGFMGAILSRKILPTLERWKYHYNSVRHHGRFGGGNDDDDQGDIGNDNTIVAKTVVNSNNSPVLSDNTVTVDGSRGYANEFETLANNLINYLVPVQQRPSNNQIDIQDDRDDDLSMFDPAEGDFYNAIGDQLSQYNDFQSTMSKNNPSIFDEISLALSHPQSSKFSAYTAQTHHTEVSMDFNPNFLDEIASACEDITPQHSQYESHNNSIAIDETMRDMADATDAARMLSMIESREVPHAR